MNRLLLSILALIFLLPLSAQRFPSPDGQPGPALPRIEQSSQPHYTQARRIPGVRNMATRGLIIMVNYADLSFSLGNQLSFDSLANGENYTFDGAYGSCREYFRAQSNDTYAPQFDVVGPYTLPHDYAYYGTDPMGDYDQYMADLIIDAVTLAAEDGIDFSLYDNDQDDFVDFVYVLYAGGGQADGGDSKTIWPHNWELSNALHYGYTNQKKYYFYSGRNYNLPCFDGKTIDAYACSSELRHNVYRTGVGTVCHEFSHVLGLADYYQTTNYPKTSSRDVPGAWSLMASGCYNGESKFPCNYSAFDKYMLGFVTPEVLHDSRVVTLPADGRTCCMVTRDGILPKLGAITPDTIYYLENRQQEGWDTCLPGHGLLIWQVVFDDKSWAENTVNDYTVRYRMLTADGSHPFSDVGADGSSKPFPGTKNITSCSLFSYSIQNIEENDGVITFQFNNPTPLNEEEILPTTPDKIICNGRLLIFRNGHYYDILGR